MNNLGPSRNSSNPDEVTKVTDELGGSGTRPNGMISAERVSPSGPDTPPQRPTYTQASPMYHSRWTRYWIEVRLLQPPSAFTEWSRTYLNGASVNPNPGDAQGRWHMVSLWSADEGRDVHRLLYRVPFNWKGRLRDERLTSICFDLQMNSSKSGLIGPLVGYVKNVVSCCATTSCPAILNPTPSCSKDRDADSRQYASGVRNAHGLWMCERR